MPQSPWQDEEFARLSLSSMDARFAPCTKQEVDFLERELRLKPGSRVLDLGCGAGRHAIELAQRGYAVVGIDVSQTMLREANKRAEETGVTIELHQMNLSDLRTELFGKESFDAAICLCMSGLGVLGGQLRDFALLETVRDLLRPGSTLIVTGFNGLRRYRNLNSKMNHVTGIFRFEAPGKNGPLLENVRMYIPSELEMLLSLAGFCDVALCGCESGNFARQELGADDIEMMAIARRPE